MSWAAQTERGAPWIVRLGVTLTRRFGWPVGRLITLGCTAWFSLSSPGPRAASRDYLRRVLRREPRLADIVRHVDAFATSILDGVMLQTGRADRYTIDVDGLPALLETLASGRGAILFGAHLGSFEALRTLALQSPVPVWPLMYRRNAGALTSVLEGADPAARDRVLEIGDPLSMIRARECVDRGEIVALLADRTPSGQREVPAPFLGATAQFPAGPWLLAASVGAPVFLFHGVGTGTRRYRIGIEPLADRVVLRRGQERDSDLRAYVLSYALALERICRAHPFQWFNFFPFWGGDDTRPGPARPPVPAAARLRPVRRPG